VWPGRRRCMNHFDLLKITSRWGKIVGQWPSLAWHWPKRTRLRVGLGMNNVKGIEYCGLGWLSSSPLGGVHHTHRDRIEECEKGANEEYKQSLVELALRFWLSSSSWPLAASGLGESVALHICHAILGEDAVPSGPPDCKLAAPVTSNALSVCR
jgi:hypothetical protein